MTTRKIRCEGQRRGRQCGTFLGEIGDGRIGIFCPACKQLHPIYITDLLAELEAMVARGRGVEQFLGELAHRYDQD